MVRERQAIANFFEESKAQGYRPTPQDMWKRAVDDAGSNGAEQRSGNNAWTMGANGPSDTPADRVQRAIERERMVSLTKVSYIY